MSKSIARGVFAGALMLLILDAAAQRLGWVSVELPRASSSSVWTLSRAFGITAYLALFLGMVFGLLVSTRAADRWLSRAKSMDLHRFFSSAALLMVAGHGLVLLAERSRSFDALGLLVPFLAPHSRFFTGVGVLAFWGALVLHLSFDLRKRIGPSGWRRLHGLSFVVFVLATLHGMFAGGGWRGIYWAALTIIGALATVRLIAIRRTSELK